jgi:transposase-like protein
VPSGATARPNPEVVARPARAHRRRFTAAYKLRILNEAAHTAIGQLGALLRREGLYSSHLANWRRERGRGALADGAAPRRGRPATPATEREVARLREENARLARKLAAAETVIEVQKKVAALLGLAPLDPPIPSLVADGRRSWRP